MLIIINAYHYVYLILNIVTRLIIIYLLTIFSIKYNRLCLIKFYNLSI